MKSEFGMSMIGELSFFLGLQVKQLNKGIMIHQQKYVKELRKKYGMEDAKVHSKPNPTAYKLDLDDKGKCVDEKVYRGMIGSLLYLTPSR